MECCEFRAFSFHRKAKVIKVYLNIPTFCGVDKMKVSFLCFCRRVYQPHCIASNPSLCKAV